MARKKKIEPIDCAKEPCSSCPYRKDVPSGLWHRDEYEKLPDYDEGAAEPALAVFLCHQTNATGRETICRGWLTVAADSIAVRLALAKEEITIEQRDAEVAAPLHKSGAAACKAGLRAINRPGKKARNLIAKLERKGIGQ